jgi:DNA-directed RNA polymerase specialized sigma24 family protein
MAQNRLTDLARRQRAQRRDARREMSLDAAAARGVEPPARDPTPSRIVAGRELLEQVRARLTPAERRIADARVAGAEWAEIAREFGESAESLRKRFARALDRITNDLDL